MKDTVTDSGFFTEDLASRDPEIFDAIGKELGRQREEIELIASENIVSRAVLEAQGSVLTNKYAEGYPGRRYYGGCQFVDVVEPLAIERAKALFDCGFANVQPNSGSQMNQAVFLALLQPGDTFMGLDLNSGGHLTHGSPVNMSGKWFNVVSYGVRQQDQLLDMEEVRAKALEHRPKLILAGGTAYSRVWDWAAFRAIADEIGAWLMVDMAHIAGLVAGGRPSLAAAARPRGHHHDPQVAARPARRPDPDQRRGCRQEDQLGGLPRPAGRAADARDRRQGRRLRRGAAPGVRGLRGGGGPKNARTLAESLMKGGLDIVTGGTDNHLMLVDLRPKGVTGKDAEAALGRAHITCNKNGIPFDPEPPAVTSGVRLGTPAGTTRGFGAPEFAAIGGMIVEVVDGLAAAGPEGNGAVEAAVKARVQALCDRFPIYPGL